VGPFDACRNAAYVGYWPKASVRCIAVSASGAALAWPYVAQAQQTAKPVVGYLSSSSADTTSALTAAFREGLAEAGFVEGKDCSFEYRWADRHLERVPALALDLIQRKVNLVFAVGTVAWRAVRSATSTIPTITVDLNSDPVDSGLVASLAHPGGNISGIFLAFPEFATKYLELLKETTPQLSRVGILWDPSIGSLQKKAVERAAEILKLPLEYLEVQTAPQLDEAFNSAARRGANGMLILNSPLAYVTARKAAELAALHNLPAVSAAADFARAGGLMAYGPNLTVTFRQAGVMSGKVLQGMNPADLPIERPTRFELVINLKAAKALGLTVPNTLLASADEVIE
jgi:putative tryptophan/tyrosine transport system substrate-binding protein